MSTTLSEIRRQVALRLPMNTGKEMIQIDQAINDAQTALVRVQDFDELIVLDTTNAATVASQKIYHLESDLGLVRPKDIFSIRYMNGTLSRKLVYIPPSRLDQDIPYTETSGEGDPAWYTQRGLYIELFRIPAEVKPLYIQHSQWPSPLEDDADTLSLTYVDDVIVALATEMAAAIILGSTRPDWLARAKELLGITVRDTQRHPDHMVVAQPFRSGGYPTRSGEYWNDPFVKE